MFICMLLDYMSRMTVDTESGIEEIFVVARLFGVWN